MKKYILAGAILLSGVCHAVEMPIVSTLVDHVTTVTQFRSGETHLALMDSVVQIGKVNGGSILDLQAGFSGDVKPDASEPRGMNFLGGGFLKVSSLLKGKINFPSHWTFLNSIEHGAVVIYDFRDKVWRGGYQVGLAFSLNPK